MQQQENKLYVGNVSFNSNEADLREAFEQFGNVSSVKLVTDRDTGRPRGFAFVEMATNDEAQRALEGLNGSSLGGRSIQVSIARPRESRDSRDSRGGGGNDRRSRW